MSDPAAQAAPESEAALNTRFYEELREVAGRVFASERADHTLQPTAVVNEACMRIMAFGLPAVSREQQLAIAGRVLKQVLVDHARAHTAQKRGGGVAGKAGSLRLDLERDMIAPDATQVDFGPMHDAIERLARLSPRQAEVVTLRIFSGLKMEQIATVLGVSKRAVEGDWTVARAWLARELSAHVEGCARE
ncbi:MAG: hypothetical protein KF745_00025 [Phycisphaeraceae bacterium]|nr:hypothetical protein [Phycisphaeraceae bacterium]